VALVIAALLLIALCGGLVLFVLRPAGQGAHQAGAAGSSGTGSQSASTPDLKDPATLVNHRPIEVRNHRFVTSEACRECHAREYESWHASYHRTMTQLADSDRIIGDFKDSPFQVRGRTFRFEKTDDQLWVELEPPGPPGRIERWPVVLATGSHHMQIYWCATGASRVLANLPIVYLKDENQWVPRNAVFLTAPDDAVPDETGRWNATCIYCHTTHGRTRPDENYKQMDTHVAQFGIACEACHGPGENHVMIRRGEKTSAEVADEIVHPAELTSQRASQICAQCHSLTVSLSEEQLKEELQQGMSYRPGDDLYATRMVVRNEESVLKHVQQWQPDLDEYVESQFWPDGMPRVSGREFTAMSQSACYEHGLSCLTCHSMHKTHDDPRPLEQWANDQLRPRLQDDASCLTCHAADQFQSPSHTHHGPESSGARCANCHMPHSSYGLLKAIRSHQISSPRVNTDLQAGRMNACNSCHLNRTLGWTADRLAEWYGQPRPELNPEQQTVSASVLHAVQGDAAQRALVAWSLGWEPARQASGENWLPPYLSLLMDDPYDAVRLIAYRSLRTLPGYQDLPRFDYIGPLPARRAVVTQIHERWRQQGHVISDGAAVLIDPQGQLQQQTLLRLLQNRDHRRLDLAE
jgi:hypothetical protein